MLQLGMMVTDRLDRLYGRSKKTGVEVQSQHAYGAVPLCGVHAGTGPEDMRLGAIQVRPGKSAGSVER